MPSFTTFVTASLMTLGAIGGGTVGLITHVAITAEPPGPDRARVIKVVDGDTIDVRYDGTEHRVRLLNIDTPETKDPNKTVECLGPEATAFLEKQLQPGDRVRLAFDTERHDRYDRELAGVYEDDVLVNAEIARQGLGVPVIFEPNRRFYDPVKAAYDEAKKSRVGMFDPALPCTFASRVKDYEETVDAAEAQATPDEVKEASDEAAKAAAALVALIDDADPKSLAAAGQSKQELQKLRRRVVTAQERAAKASDDAARTIAVEAKKKAEAERKKAEAKAEAERKKAEAEAEAERKEAEERRRAEEERQRAEEEAQRAADEAAAQEAQRQEQTAPEPTPTYSAPPPPSDPGVPGAGYTGCRAYIGGPYIDDQGRHYTPIDCETRQPLVP